jgi:signal transduction histidine kinase
VKFTERGGVTVRAALEDGGLHVSVSDTGIGVRPDDLKTLFLAFSQVDASHARRYEGTGLGLALSRRLAEAHGGRIWVESVFGQGSTFHVWLPFQAGRER